MVIENLSPRTITSYLNGPKRLIEYCNKDPRKISTDEIYAFLVYQREVKNHSRSTMRINVNGIRYLCKHFLNRPEIVDEIPYPKQEKYLPEIFTGYGLRCLFNNITNTKHRVLLKMIYSCGLRRGEVRNIRLIDIQRKNMQVVVRQGKYLFPVKAMSKVFRGKLCDGLIGLQDQCVIKLQTPLAPQKKYLHPLYKTRWVVFAKRPVQHGEKTLEYLGRYVHSPRWISQKIS